MHVQAANVMLARIVGIRAVGSGWRCGYVLMLDVSTDGT